jgi:hypothetical protein
MSGCAIFGSLKSFPNSTKRDELAVLLRQYEAVSHRINPPSRSFPYQRIVLHASGMTQVEETHASYVVGLKTKAAVIKGCIF